METNAENKFSQEEAFAFAEHYDDNPLSLLTPDERRGLLRIAIELSRQCDRLSSIDKDWCRREFEAYKQSHCNNPDGNLHPRVSETMGKQSHCYQSPRRDCHFHEEDGKHNFEPKGVRGMSGQGLIGSIGRDLEIPLKRILMLFHKEFLQTTFALEGFRSWLHQSDGDNIHVKTGKSTGTKNYHDYLKIFDEYLHWKNTLGPHPYDRL